jgi:hypothetical protein
MCSLAAMRPTVGTVPEHTVRIEPARLRPDAACTPHTYPYVVYTSPFGGTGEPFWAWLHPLVRRVGRRDVTTDWYTLVSKQRTSDDVNKWTHPNRQAYSRIYGLNTFRLYRGCQRVWSSGTAGHRGPTLGMWRTQNQRAPDRTRHAVVACMHLS